MKKRLFLIFSFIVLLLGVNTKVLAFSGDESFTKTTDYSKTINDLKYCHNKSCEVYFTERYSMSSGGPKFDAYCMDPSSSAYKGPYKIRRIIDGDTTNLPRTVNNAHDMGLYYLAKKSLEGSTDGKIDEDTYFATSLAIRTYINGYFGWALGDSTEINKKTIALIKIGNDWGKGYYNFNQGKLYYNKHTVLIDNIKTKNGYQMKNMSYEFSDSNLSKKTKLLYDVAAKKATEFIGGQLVSNTPVVKSEILESSINNIVEKITIKNFDLSEESKSYLKYTDFKSELHPVSIEYSTDNENWSALGSGFDLLGGFKGTNKSEIEVYIKITLNPEEVKSFEDGVDYDTHYSYYDSGMITLAILERKKAIDDVQRFVIIDKAKVRNDKIHGVINGNYCLSKIKVPECSEDEDISTSEVYAPKDIKKCILGKKDEAGNDYQLSKANGGVENKYCKVYCKEDYSKIKFNPIVNKPQVKCGETFYLESEIFGNKDCYASDPNNEEGEKSINRKQFLEDMKNYQAAMYENFGYYKAAKDALGKIHSISSKYTGEIEVTRTTDIKDDKGNVIGHDTTTSCEVCKIVGGYNSEGFYNGLAVTDVDNDGVASTTSQRYMLTFTDDGGSSDNSCGSSCGSPKPGDRGVLESNIKAAMSGYYSAMEAAYNSFLNAIKDYNDCTIGWKNDFKFAQKINWYYDETRQIGNDKVISTDYYDMLKPEQTYLVEEGASSEDSSVEICKTNVDKEYNCANPINSEAGALKKVTYYVCHGEECESYTTDVSEAIFVKKSAEKKQHYKTPDLYGQTIPGGKIVLMDEYTNDATIQYEQLYGLPTAFNLVGGGRFRMSLEDLGEFYDSGESGRLVDFGDDKNTVADALGSLGEDSFDGNYKCYYESACFPDDCPKCEYKCTFKGKDDCTFELCPACVSECINCIFDLNDLKLNFKVISPTNIKDQVDGEYRVFGYNWNIINDISSPLYFVSEKAKDTLKDIDDKQELIYDKDTKDDNLEFSVIMTPEMTKYIRKHNKKIEKEEVGSYANDSVTCYDLDGYKNIVCYSDFLDELYENDKFKDQVIFNSKRENNVDKRKSNPNGNGYWTLSDKYETYKNNPNLVGGPSWK